MTSKQLKNMNHWTDKHESFCLEKGIIGSAERLWYWLTQNNSTGKEIEAELLEFNQWVEQKRGKGYCPRQLKNAFNKLVENGIIAPIKRFSWHCYKLCLIPLRPVKPTEEKKSDIEHNNSKVPDENKENIRKNAHSFYQQQKYLFSVDTKVSEDTRKSIRDICGQANITLPNNKCEIFYYSPIEVKACVSIYKQRILNSPKLLRGFSSLFEICPNPIGWMIEALREKYYLEEPNIAILAKDKSFDFQQFFYSLLNQ